MPVIGRFFIADFYELGEKASNIELEGVQVRASKMRYQNFPINSMQRVTIEEDRMIHKIVKLLSDPKSGRVYVHCEHGKDRTGLIVALYRVCHQGWSPDAAYAEMMEKGHGARANQFFTHSMDNYFLGAMMSPALWCNQ